MARRLVRRLVGMIWRWRKTRADVPVTIDIRLEGGE